MRVRRLLIIAVPAVALFAMPAVSAPPPAPAAPLAPRWVSTSHHVAVGHLTRTYLLVRPPATRNQSLPVIIILHGRNATPEVAERQTGFEPYVGRAILVYPAGYQNSWNAGACCGGAHIAAVDDVGFLTRLVDHVVDSQHDAARRRVFLVGFSNGGRMASRLSCAQPAMFAGVAIVGAMPVATCPRPPRVPLIEMAFAGDPLLTLTASQPHKRLNGYEESSIEEQVAAQRRVNACTATANSRAEPGLMVTSWTACAGGRSVELAVYDGATHAWPGGDVSRPSGAQLIWQFFQTVPPSSA
ncbi:MAG: hypothetical protein M3159_08245 [Actinomycetota bacterium]|nr:hypothetical protein [Actinomycetota bacterium]